MIVVFKSNTVSIKVDKAINRRTLRKLREQKDIKYKNNLRAHAIQILGKKIREQVETNS